MSVRHILRLAKCDVRQATPFCRFVTTGFASTKREQSARFEVDYGAHFRAPHGKDVCEDAYFVWEKPGIAAFGVADGVSSWSRYAGVDASLFPNTLLANCMKHLEERQGKIPPQTVLAGACLEILQNNQVEAGSSTVCLGIFDKESGLLQTANLGDSGFCIFRSGQTLFKSKEQYNHPNVPYQVGVKEIKDGKSIPHGNSPSDAAVSNFNLEDNDLLILGTDGLFDNLFPQDIMDEIGPLSPREGIDWMAICKHLAKTAMTRSVELTPGRITPREKRMQEHDDDPLVIPGGNFDDVTVVAIHVKA